MNGTITFPNVIDLAEFLKAFTGSTAVFKVELKYDGGPYILTFTGGF